MKKISVIITTYNSSKTIVRLLNSIVEQTGYRTDFDLEILVVDDCSTDNTLDLARTFDVLIFSTETNTGGPNKSRNIGLTNSTGDYICIADHDDEWHKDKLITQLPFMKQAPIVSSGFTIIDSTTTKQINRGNTSSSGHLFFKKNETFMDRLQKAKSGQSVYLGSLMLDRSLKELFFEEHFGMVDFDYQLRLFHNNASIEVTQPLYYRHVEGKNLSLDHSYRMKDFYYSLYFIEQFRSQYPREYRQAYKRLHGSRARFHYVVGEMKLARYYFRRSPFTVKSILYYLTTFYGSEFVKKKSNIFG